MKRMTVRIVSAVLLLALALSMVACGSGDDTTASTYGPLPADLDFTVDLSGVQQVSKHCSLEANCSFGELTIRVPSKFAVMQSNSGAFSDSSTSGHADPEPEGTIYLDSNVSFGEIHVEYI